MRRSDFKLERLLECRRIMEAQRAALLARASRQLLQAREEEQQALAQWLAGQEAVASQRRQAADARELLLGEEHEHALRADSSQAAAVTREKGAAAEHEREAVVRAWQERQMVERLKARHLRRLRAEQLREEQAVIDELATTRTSRAAKAR
jgi:flagellar FliJ protein